MEIASTVVYVDTLLTNLRIYLDEDVEETHFFRKKLVAHFIIILIDSV